jgi:hypothetical protein
MSIEPQIVNKFKAVGEPQEPLHRSNWKHVSHLSPVQQAEPLAANAAD